MCGDPERRDVAEGGGARRGSGSAQPARPRSEHLAAPASGSRVLPLEGALLVPARRALPGRRQEHMVGIAGGPAAGPGVGGGSPGLLFREEGLAAFTPYLDPPARVTARREPRFLRDPNGAPQSLSYPVLLNVPAYSSTLDHPLKRKGLWPLLSPWPSGCRQVVPERPRLT